MKRPNMKCLRDKSGLENLTDSLQMPCLADFIYETNLHEVDLFLFQMALPEIYALKIVYLVAQKTD